MQEYPTVSIIIPVFSRDKERYLTECLSSIDNSTYPINKIQIIIKEGLPAEEAKAEALKEVEGDYVMFLDSDNILLPDYLNEAVNILQQDAHSIGVETDYYPAGCDLNIFLTSILHISDPISYLISKEPKVIPSHGEDCSIWYKLFWKGSYPLGANGFLYRKKDLDRVKAEFGFEDTQIPLRLFRTGGLHWSQPINCGVKHYYVDNLWQFFLKRRRQTFHYLKRKEQGINRINWTMLGPKMPKWLALLYCCSVFAPIITMLVKLPSNRLWLWWPLCCYVSALGLVAGVVTFYWQFVTRRTMDEISLQPERI